MEAHEIELVKRLQAGDQQAFDELYQQYGSLTHEKTMNNHYIL